MNQPSKLQIAPAQRPFGKPVLFPKPTPFFCLALQHVNCIWLYTSSSVPRRVLNCGPIRRGGLHLGRASIGKQGRAFYTLIVGY